MNVEAGGSSRTFASDACHGALIDPCEMIVLARIRVRDLTFDERQDPLAIDFLKGQVCCAEVFSLVLEKPVSITNYENRDVARVRANCEVQTVVFAELELW